jgi:hypothetical protein
MRLRRADGFTTRRYTKRTKATKSIFLVFFVAFVSFVYLRGILPSALAAFLSTISCEALRQVAVARTTSYLAAGVRT